MPVPSDMYYLKCGCSHFVIVASSTKP